MKKKAFTLTELLVVVVIIGVLAAVVLPKFTRVIEARKTTEAEEIMRAVRSEQEARCTLDKNYTANATELAAMPRHPGSNYSYDLQASGISATATDNGYTLHMAYRDGRICCQGSECNDLGKYNTCTNEYLTQVTTASNECSATALPGVGVGPHNGPQGCDLNNYDVPCEVGEGYVHYYVNDDCTGYDVDDSECTVSNPEPNEDSECTEGQQEKVRFVDCSTELWKRCTNGKWEEFNKNVTSTDCRQNCGKPEDDTQDCEEGTTGTQTRTYECNQSTGSWEAGEWTGECTCTPTEDGKTTYAKWCGDVEGHELQIGSIYYTWDSEKCEYNERVGCSDRESNEDSPRTWKEKSYASNQWQNTFQMGGGSSVCVSALSQMVDNSTLPSGSNGTGLTSVNGLCSIKGYYAGNECNQSGGPQCVQSYELNCVHNGHMNVNCADPHFGQSNDHITGGEWYCYGKLLTYLTCE